eukprot:3413573-Amphidinium_carterae.1
MDDGACQMLDAREIEHLGHGASACNVKNTSGPMIKSESLWQTEDGCSDGAASSHELVGHTASADIRKGVRVKVVGLKAQSHLNGQLGTVEEWVPEESRWKVMLDDNASKMLRLANLEVSTADAASNPSIAQLFGEARRLGPGKRVRAVGLQAQ